MKCDGCVFKNHGCSTWIVAKQVPSVLCHKDMWEQNPLLPHLPPKRTPTWLVAGVLDLLINMRYLTNKLKKLEDLVGVLKSGAKWAHVDVPADKKTKLFILQENNAKVVATIEPGDKVLVLKSKGEK